MGGGAKGKGSEKGKKDQGKGRNISASVRFSEIGGDTHRSAVLSTDQVGISEENGGDLVDREV